MTRRSVLQNLVAFSASQSIDNQSDQDHSELVLKFCSNLLEHCADCLVSASVAVLPCTLVGKRLRSERTVHPAHGHRVDHLACYRSDGVVVASVNLGLFHDAVAVVKKDGSRLFYDRQETGSVAYCADVDCAFQLAPLSRLRSQAKLVAFREGKSGETLRVFEAVDFKGPPLALISNSRYLALQLGNQIMLLDPEGHTLFEVTGQPESHVLLTKETLDVVSRGTISSYLISNGKLVGVRRIDKRIERVSRELPSGYRVCEVRSRYMSGSVGLMDSKGKIVSRDIKYGRRRIDAFA